MLIQRRYGIGLRDLVFVGGKTKRKKKKREKREETENEKKGEQKIGS